MSCTGLSVIQGTEISSFDVEILDVIAAEPGLSGPRHPRCACPARRWTTTGIGPGFSGSPIVLRRPQRRRDLRGPRRVRQQGRARHADRGDARATGRTRRRPAPRARPGAAARRAPARHAAHGVRASPAAPRRCVSGRPRARGPAAARGARRAARRLPARRRCARAPSVAAAISTGDLALGAVGTVDLPRRRRHLGVRPSLRRARASARCSSRTPTSTRVIQNPLGIPDFGAITYKLASADGQRAGRRDERHGRRDRRQGRRRARRRSRCTSSPGTAPASTVTLRTRCSPTSATSAAAPASRFVAPLGAHQALGRLMRRLRAVDAPHVPALPRARAAQADGLLQPLLLRSTTRSTTSPRPATLVDFFDFAPLHVERISIGARVRRGVKEDVIVAGSRATQGAQGLAHARAAHRFSAGAARATRSPCACACRARLRPGRVHRLTISGGGGGFSEEALVEELIAMLDGEVGRWRRRLRAADRPPARAAHSLAPARARHLRALRPPLRAARLPLGDVSYEGRVRLGCALRRAPLTSGAPPFAGAAAATVSVCSSACS